jgi:hypothetical protein
MSEDGSDISEVNPDELAKMLEVRKFVDCTFLTTVFASVFSRGSTFLMMNIQKQQSPNLKKESRVNFQLQR